MAYMHIQPASSKRSSTSPPPSNLPLDAYWHRREPAVARPAPPEREATGRSLLDLAIANRQMLVNMARGVVGCASRAEDVVHDVFVSLIDLPQQDAVRQPMGYIARMVRNASIDACRRQSLENIYRADEEDGLDVPSHELSPESARAGPRHAAPRLRCARAVARAQSRRLRNGAAARRDAAKRGARAERLADARALHGARRPAALRRLPRRARTQCRVSGVRRR